MSSETLGLLASPTPLTATLALKSLNSLSSAPQALQHKVAVRISALLKSKNAERAFATVLATKALACPEIVKSHAATWCPILLHLLDLPQAECWKGAIKALSTIFNVAELRDIGGASRIADFLKRLIGLIPQMPEPALNAIAHLCNTHPTPLRNYIPQIVSATAQVVWTSSYKFALNTRALLVFAEKTPIAAWREQTIALITDLKLLCNGKPLQVLTQSPLEALENDRVWCALQAQFDISPAGAKVPTQRLVEAVSVALRSSNPQIATSAVKFLLATRERLGSIWLQHFDTLVHSVIETSNYGADALSCAIECVAMLLDLIKITPKQYVRALYSLFNKAYNTVYPNIDTQTTSQTIASMVEYQFTDGARRSLAIVLGNLSEVLIRSVEEIPASFRTKLDANLLSIGGRGLYTATLYPGKYSMLPITLHHGLQGYEALVHPRFPPLAQAAKEGSAFNTNTDYELVESEAQSQVPIVEAVKMVEEVQAEPVPLPEIELAPIPSAPEASEKPALTFKRDSPQPEPVAKRPKVESEDEDGDDDFVIPEIEMDSD